VTKILDDDSIFFFTNRKQEFLVLFPITTKIPIWENNHCDAAHVRPFYCRAGALSSLAHSRYMIQLLIRARIFLSTGLEARLAPRPLENHSFLSLLLLWYLVLFLVWIFNFDVTHQSALDEHQYLRISYWAHLVLWLATPFVFALYWVRLLFFAWHVFHEAHIEVRRSGQEVALC